MANFLRGIAAYLVAALVLLFATVTVVEAKGSSDQECDVEALMAQIEALKSRVESIEQEQQGQQVLPAEKSEKDDGFYTPKVFGAIMAYYNVSGYDGQQRFVVRNTRFGVKGNAADRVSYGIQIDFHNLGVITMLDAYLTYKEDNFNLTLGQQQIHFTQDMDDGASTNLFVTRSYSAIYATLYYSGNSVDGYSVKSIGSRDIGIYSNYTTKWDVPVNFGFGVFNGSGINTIEWNDGVNVDGRITIGSKTGLRASGSVYSGHSAMGHDMTLWAGEVIYNGNRLYAESNYIQRRQRDTELHLMNMGVVQGQYKFPMSKSKVFESYAPALRWDCCYDIAYVNLDTSDINFVDANRVSASMNLFFRGAKIRTRLSIGYEKVFMEELPSDIDDNPTFQDKFNVGLTACF